MNSVRRRHSLVDSNTNQPEAKTQSVNVQELEKVGGLISQFSEGSMLRLCIQILKLPSNERNENQIMIINQMSSKLSFFRTIKRQYGNKLQVSCLNCIQHQSVSQGEVLFQAGEKGTRFYIILEGLVGIYISLPSLLDKTVFEKKKINQLGPGESFGELALLYKNSIRSATVIAQTDVELAFMEQKEYERVIGSYQREQIEKKIQFLSQQPWLSKWSKREIQTLSYHFILQKFNSNDTIFQEGQVAEEIFLVKQGQFIDYFRVFEMTKLYSKQDQNSVKMSEVPSQLRRSHFVPTKKIICHLEFGQIFGEECLIYDDKFRIQFRPIEKQDSINRISTVQCKSINGELYRIQKSVYNIFDLKDLEQRFWDTQTVSIFTDTVQMIADYRINRIKMIELQLKEANDRMHVFYENKIFDKSQPKLNFKQTLYIITHNIILLECIKKKSRIAQLNSYLLLRSAQYDNILYIQEIKEVQPPNTYFGEQWEKNLKKVERLKKNSPTTRTLSQYCSQASQSQRQRIKNFSISQVSKTSRGRQSILSHQDISRQLKDQKLVALKNNIYKISCNTESSQKMFLNQIQTYQYMIEQSTSVKLKSCEEQDQQKSPRFYNRMVFIPKKKGLISLQLKKQIYLQSLSQQVKDQNLTSYNSKMKSLSVNNESIQNSIIKSDQPSELSSNQMNGSIRSKYQQSSVRSSDFQDQNQTSTHYPQFYANFKNKQKYSNKLQL